MIKKVLFSPFIFISSLAQRALSVIGAVLFAQFPAFLVHYIQRLGGHVGELSRIIGAYKKAAGSTGKTLEEYISRHLSSSDPTFVETGKIMSKNLERYEDLNLALSAIKKGEIWEKPMEFLKNFDAEIFKATLKDYVLSINLSTEAIIYAFIGIVVTMAAISLIKVFFSLIFRKTLGGKKHGKGDFLQ